MRLINPGTGEVSDRLTILSLKILAGRDDGKDVAHFEAERAALLTKVRTKTLNGAWFEHVLELAAVNAMLWQAEDALRAVRHPTTVVVHWENVGQLAIRIQALNDRRSELVGLINKTAGDAEHKEKV